jgi:hypothetical protein
MWLGGAISWTLSLCWKVLTVAAAVSAWHETGWPFAAGLIVLTVASALPLFADSVLTRADRTRVKALSGRARRTVPDIH